MDRVRDPGDLADDDRGPHPASYLSAPCGSDLAAPRDAGRAGVVVPAGLRRCARGVASPTWSSTSGSSTRHPPQRPTSPPWRRWTPGWGDHVRARGRALRVADATSPGGCLRRPVRARARAGAGLLGRPRAVLAPGGPRTRRERVDGQRMAAADAGRSCAAWSASSTMRTRSGSGPAPARARLRTSSTSARSPGAGPPSPTVTRQSTATERKQPMTVLTVPRIRRGTDPAARRPQRAARLPRRP